MTDFLNINRQFFSIISNLIKFFDNYKFILYN